MMSISTDILHQMEILKYAGAVDRENEILYLSSYMQRETGLPSTNRMKNVVVNYSQFCDWSHTKQTAFDLQLVKTTNHHAYYRLQKISTITTGQMFLMTNIDDILAIEMKQNYDRLQNKKLTNNIPCGLFKAALDESMTLLYHNLYFNKTFGYDPTDAISDIQQIVLPDEFMQLLKDIRSHKITASDTYYFEEENRCIKKDGSIIWVLCRYAYEGNDIFGAVFDITDRKLIEDRLRISEQEYRIAMKQLNKTLLRYHIPTKTLSMGDPDDRVLGDYTEVKNVPECVQNMNLVAKESLEEYMRFYHAMLEGVPQGSAMFKLRVKDRDDYAWIKANYFLTYDKEKHPVTSIISYEDYTEEYDQELSYQRWIQIFENQKANAIAYYEYDITKDQLEVMESTVIPEIPFAKRRSFTFVAQYAANNFVYAKDRKKYLTIFDRQYLLSCYYQKKFVVTCEHRRYDVKKHIYWAKAEIQLMEDPYTKHIKAFVLIQDIDKIKCRELEVQLELESDSLTGLLNRKTIAEKVDYILQEQEEELHALIMLDLDNFKQLNDKLGHMQGDEVLRDVAQILRGLMRSHDLCARIGGDEYILFLKDICNREALRKKLQQLSDALSFNVDGITISASLGACLAPEHGDNFMTLYQKADEAMYARKRNGRHGFRIYGE